MLIPTMTSVFPLLGGFRCACSPERPVLGDGDEGWRCREEKGWWQKSVYEGTKGKRAETVTSRLSGGGCGKEAQRRTGSK